MRLSPLYFPLKIAFQGNCGRAEGDHCRLQGRVRARGQGRHRLSSGCAARRHLRKRGSMGSWRVVAWTCLRSDHHWVREFVVVGGGAACGVWGGFFVVSYLCPGVTLVLVVVVECSGCPSDGNKEKEEGTRKRRSGCRSQRRSRRQGA